MRGSIERRWLAAARAMLALVLLLPTGSLAIGAQEPQSARERWNKLSHEEREMLKRRFETLQGMSEDERRAVMERFQRVRALERGAREELSDEKRRELSALDPRAQREAMRGILECEFAERGRAMREFLPRELRERIEQASPPERDRLVAEFQEHLRRDKLEHVLHELARKLRMTPQEVERVRSLPPEEQRREMFALHRREIEFGIAEHGLPPWLSQAEWDAWETLDPAQFVERWSARQRELGFPRREPGPPDARQGPPDSPPRGPHGAAHPDPRRVRELLERLRPDPKWFGELSHLDPAARREAVDARMRERVLEFLKDAPELVDAQQLERLEKLHGREFLEAVRERVHQVAPPPPRERGGPDGPREHDRPPGPKPPQRQ